MCMYANVLQPVKCDVRKVGGRCSAEIICCGALYVECGVVNIYCKSQ